MPRQGENPLTGVLQSLLSSLPPPARNAGLAIARLGDECGLGRGGFTLTSPAFGQGGELDPCFTADEEDAVAPPLEWSAPPGLAQELVLIVENASTPGAEPACHWLAWGLAAQRGKLLEGELPPRTGKNAHGNSEWLLPDPPGDETQHFVFQLFALDLPLALMPGATRADLLAQMDGHVVASSVLVAHYTRPPEESGDRTDDDALD